MKLRLVDASYMRTGIDHMCIFSSTHPYLTLLGRCESTGTVCLNLERETIMQRRACAQTASPAHDARFGVSLVLQVWMP
jgi:hypothetical protein